MPKVKTLKSKKTPKDWEIVEEKLTEFANQMRDAENQPHEGKRKAESLWPIWRLHH